MTIIDAHIHFSNIDSFIQTAKDISHVDYSSSGYSKEFAANNVVKSIGMGLTEQAEGSFPDTESSNPMLLDLEEETPENILTCVGINPSCLTGITRELELVRIEEELMKEHVVGIKIYAGYYHVHVFDEVYDGIYDLAAKYGIPVVIHSGDTYSDRGLLKYSHPLHVDELAVKRRDVNFIISHIGDPWVMDCAEVVAKNPNVYADLSGLIVGDKDEVLRMSNEPLFCDHIKRALVYADDYSKFIFGSDWPLVDLEAYIEFIKKIVPQEHHEKVFYENARLLYQMHL